MRVPDALKAGLWTAFFTFVTLFGTSVVDWLQDVIEWASDDGAVLAFPDASVLVKAGVSAAVAALTGAVNAAVRWAQDATGIGPATPTYTPPER